MPVSSARARLAGAQVAARKSTGGQSLAQVPRKAQARQRGSLLASVALRPPLASVQPAALAPHFGRQSEPIFLPQSPNLARELRQVRLGPAGAPKASGGLASGPPDAPLPPGSSWPTAANSSRISAPAGQVERRQLGGQWRPLERRSRIWGRRFNSFATSGVTRATRPTGQLLHVCRLQLAWTSTAAHLACTCCTARPLRSSACCTHTVHTSAHNCTHLRPNGAQRAHCNTLSPPAHCPAPLWWSI